ncbi:MAG: manganese efflux pump MntP family protein [Sphaerochaetaceae bacterium]|jgi:putative Mn2+ efflux pump MntP|nr:manganese efflux pump MntP family protein [Sphaerochaetaceae bacterium]MDD4008069.1 manganese efflux pump MntP family protein [Sphaerochaetaceae bacterium]
MTFWEIAAIGVALSVDAFVVSVCKGLQIRTSGWKEAFIYAFVFGFFQAAMPLAGYFIGAQFASVLSRFSRWIAFGCFLVLGVKTIADSLRKKSCSCSSSSDSGQTPDLRINVGELLALAIATSIDALIVGFSLALLSVNIFQAITIIGVITFALCFIAVMLGRILGARIERISSWVGGIILILLAIKVLLG